MELCAIIVFLFFDRRPRRQDHGGLEPGGALSQARGLLFSGAFVLAGTVAYCEIREIKPTQETLMMASGVVGSLVTLLAKPQPPVLPTTQETVTTTATSTTPP